MDGHQPTDVIVALKRALERVRDDTGVSISGVAVTLKAQVDQSAGAALKLKIPFLDALELGASARQQVAQTLYFEFGLPALDRGVAQARATIEDSVVGAIDAFKAAVTVAYDGLQGKPLVLGAGWSEISFIFDAEGHIDLIFSTAIRENYANTVRVTYNPPAL